jgi:hypothetical protein
MDTKTLIGVVKGATALTIFRPIAENVYNQTLKIGNLYDVNITSPLNNQILYFLSPSYRNKGLVFQTGTTGAGNINIFWADMIGEQLTALNALSQTLTYNNAINKFVQYQRLHSSAQGSNATLNATRMITNGIFSLINTNTPSANYAFFGGSATVAYGNTTVNINVMASYLVSSNSGILLQNGCYNRTFEINGFISIPLTTFTDNSSFILYVYLGDTVISQTSVSCRTGDVIKYINIYAVINTTVANLGQKIDLRIKYTGSVLTVGAGVFSFSVKSL